MTDTTYDPRLAGDNPLASAPVVRDQRAGYIPGLDGVRGISIALVMVAHYGFGSLVPGGLGVTIFFFLSGFLITGLLLTEQEKTGTISLRLFYIRRFLRLAPELGLLVLVGCTVGLLFKPVHWWDIVASLTYTNNYVALYNEAYTHAPIRWPHLWSLAIEEQFYLTFPLIVLLLGRHPRLLLRLLIISCVVALCWRLSVAWWGAPFGFRQTGTVHPYTYCATDCRFDSLVYGGIAAILFRLRPAPLEKKAAWTALLLGGVLFLVSLAFRGEVFRETFRYTLQGLAMIATFYGIFGNGTGIVMSVLEQPMLKQMGVLSYGAYLWHLEPLRRYEAYIGQSIHISPMGDRLFMTVLGFVATFGLAYLSFKLCAPIRNMRSRYHAKEERN